MTNLAFNSFTDPQAADYQDTVSHSLQHQTINNALRNISAGILSTTTGIDGKTIATIDLYTVPAGKSAIITKGIIRPTTVTNLTVVPVMGAGRNATQDDIFSSQTLTGIDANSFWIFNPSGKVVIATAGEIIKLGIDTGATATTLTLSSYLCGFLI